MDGPQLVLASVKVPWEVALLVFVGGAAVSLLSKGISFFTQRAADRNTDAKSENEQDKDSGERQYWLVEPSAINNVLMPRATAPQDVDVTVFAPPVALSDDEIIIQAIFHTLDKEDEARLRASKVDPKARQLASVPLTIQLQTNDLIKVTVDSANATIADPVRTANWNGRLVCIYFIARLPMTSEPIKIMPVLRVFVNGIPAGEIVFKIMVTPLAPETPPVPVNELSRNFRRSFLSYASEDRLHVLKSAQLIRALKMECFQDILSLSPGDRWSRRLYEEIENCDVFLLFWSQHARASQWVIKEAEYALRFSRLGDRSHPLEIVPILLEGPPAIAPPPSLDDIHFNDPLRYVIFAEEIASGKAQSEKN
jgi:hypothetical protein